MDRTEEQITAEACDAAGLAIERAAEIFRPPDSTWTEADWTKVLEEMARIATQLRNEGN